VRLAAPDGEEPAASREDTKTFASHQLCGDIHKDTSMKTKKATTAPVPTPVPAPTPAVDSVPPAAPVASTAVVDLGERRSRKQRAKAEPADAPPETASGDPDVAADAGQAAPDRQAVDEPASPQNEPGSPPLGLFPEIDTTPALLPPAESRPIPISAIRRSPLNPRIRFDPQALDELAQSIRTKGLIQPLVVRPARDEPGAFEIAAGERRWRAVGLLVERGLAASDYPVPCIVRDLTDQDLLELALSENLQRKDMHFMEEAYGFAALARSSRRGDNATGRIADRFGKTQRWVQLRIQLAERLSPVLQEACLNDELTLEAARAYTIGSVSQQEDLWNRRGATLTPTSIRATLAHSLPKVAWAVFPIEDYQGEIVGEADEALFLDPDEYRKLQTAAIEELVAELQADHATVKKLDTWYPWEWEKGGDGAVYHVDPDTLRVDTLVGVRKRKASTSSSASGSSSSRPAVAPPGDGPGRGDARKPAPLPITSSALGLARTLQIATLQVALLKDPAAALRLLCFGLYAENETLSLSVEAGAACSESVLSRLRELAQRLDHPIPPQTTPVLPIFQMGTSGPDRLWTALADASGEEIVSLLALSAVATLTGDFWISEEAPEIHRLAQALDVQHAEVSDADVEAVLAGYEEERLLDVAVQTGAAKTVADARKRKRENLTRQIVKSRGDWLPEELRFRKEGETEEDASAARAS
jgi:ParB/RepB/Spo0J family partition protein